jgi:RNA polymerase sigma factor (sigma-70 family)
MKGTSANVTDRAPRTITTESFGDFLAWLDGGADSEGESYLMMRKRLVAYFDRRNCINPEELADESLNRVARRLAEEGGIESDSPAKYCYTVARFVLLEYFRSAKPREVSLESAPQIRQYGISHSAEAEDGQSREKLLDCLEKCAEKLEEKQRDLIFGYYSGERRTKIENRKRTADALGISVNALSIRACRIREKLEVCVKRCADAT